MILSLKSSLYLLYFTKDSCQIRSNSLASQTTGMHTAEFFLADSHELNVHCKFIVFLFFKVIECTTNTLTPCLHVWDTELTSSEKH